jgi:hypothetical protein
MLDEFALKHLSAHQRKYFRLAVLGKLSDGRPGDAALRKALRLTAAEFGFTDQRLSSLGLIFPKDRNDTKRAGISDVTPRRRRRKGKFG